MEQQELIPHLFRSEYRKIVSVLSRYFGFDQLEIAEDLASDTFLAAAQSWTLNGIPKNPVAWLYHVARNNATNYVKRNSIYHTKVKNQLPKESFQDIDIDLSEGNIIDSQLQMMFAISHPSIPTEAQVGLALRILCGFGIEEIADAFLTNKETINKRLFRAKEKLREEKIRIEFPGEQELESRLDSVLTTIYLLFNEGYYSISKNSTLRKDFCYEAIRLCTMLVDNEKTNKPRANALLALMCLHASRFDARINDSGELVLYQDQDTTLWDQELISRGAYYLGRSASGNKLSKYHLQATIAFWNTRKEDSPEKWETVLQLYNRLLQIDYSPVAALNRTYALAKANGAGEGIIEAEKLKLTGNQFYFTLLGELYREVNPEKAIENLETALKLVKTDTDRNVILKKIAVLKH